MHVRSSKSVLRTCLLFVLFDTFPPVLQLTIMEPSSQCSRWAAPVENRTVVISHHHCVCRRQRSVTFFFDWLLRHDSYWVQSEVKHVGQLEKNKLTLTPMNVQMPLFSQTSTFCRTELFFRRIRKMCVSQKTLFFLSDTTEWELFISVNQCHDNGNYHYFLCNYVSCILECGQLRFALVALKGQRFRGETFRHCVFFFTDKSFETWLTKKNPTKNKGNVWKWNKSQLLVFFE